MGYAPIYPLTSKPEDVLAALNAHDLRNAFYLDIYFKGIYTESAMTYLQENHLAPIVEPGDMDLIREGYSDFLALNYYASECAKACPKESGKAIRYSGVNLSGKKARFLVLKHILVFTKCVKIPILIQLIGIGRLIQLD